MNKTVAIRTLGCKVNQYESQALAQLFEKRGYEVVEFEGKADVYVINTCTVTGMSARKSRQMIRRAKKTNPRSVVAVMGCYSQTRPEEISRIEGVDLVMGTQDRHKLPEYVERLEMTCGNLVRVSDISGKREYEELGIDTYRDRSRVYVKIQDGCSRFCSYCIIPYARGPARSRKPDEILAEVRKLAEEGFREIVLTGIHVASYGTDLEDVGLMDMIKMIHETDGVERIRLSSLEPGIMSSRFINEAALLPKLCSHFHISLQSGCDDTLRRMNRKYGTDDYDSIVREVTDAIPDVAITTDVIAGFPGETGDEFKKALSYLEKLPLSDIHVFKYSPREGTPAASFQGQVPPDIKEKRSRQLIEMANVKRREFYKRFMGRKMDVLFENALPDDSGMLEGRTSNYIRVAASGDPRIIGEIKEVALVGLEGKRMLGNMENENSV